MTETPTPRLLTHLAAATMTPGGAPYGLIPEAAIVLDGGRIAWLGPATELPAAYSVFPSEDCGGRLATPALIDAHTHLVFGGDRALEFEMRLNGASYEEIARAGGGIVSTVTATRALSEDDLIAAARPRLAALKAEGVAGIEIKSGYGLTIEDELKMLRAATRLAEEAGLRLHRSYLAAHAVAPEYKGRAGAYLSEVVLPGLAAAAAEGLVESVDGFCEGIAFSPDEIALVFDAARALGLPVRLHAEQLSDLGGAALAASYGALSVDHLEYLSPEGVAAMAAAGSVAMLLPGAFYTLHETKKPPVAALREAGVPIGLATDCNPGTSPMTSLLLAMNMGATLFGLTPEEALAGVTRNAAKALGWADAGQLAPGMRADIALWDVARPAELAYRIGFNPLHQLIIAGQS